MKPIVLDARSTARFWSKVARGEPDACWPYREGRDKGGYGSFTLYPPGKKRGHVQAQRVAWVATHGPIPDGLQALHRCDNPPCCNPAHLFLGTGLDNMRDKVAKGRHVSGMALHPESALRGEAHPNAILTEADVAWIRSVYEPGRHKRAWTQRAIAEKFGVHRDTIKKAASGTYWKHVPSAPQTP